MDDQKTQGTTPPVRRPFPHPEKPVFGQRHKSNLMEEPRNTGFLIPSADGWLLVSARGNTRGVLRKSHGWTEQTAQEALRLQEGDVLL